jgi:hypothetical protein
MVDHLLVVVSAMNIAECIQHISPNGRDEESTTVLK